MRGQQRRAHLREDLDPHPVRVRGRRLRPGRPRHLPRPDRHRRWGTRSRSTDTARVLGRMFDAIEYRGFGAGDGRGARGVRRRAGLERPHRRVAPHPDARRLAHDAASTRAASRLADIVVLLPRRRPLQHGQLAARHGRDHGHRTCASSAPKALWPSEDVQAIAPRARRAVGRPPDAHRGPGRGPRRRRLRAHRRVGVDGRAQGGLGPAHRAALAVPGERRGAGVPPATRT